MNSLFNELQADIIGKTIVAPVLTEVSGWGAAVAGGIGAGEICLEEFRNKSPKASVYSPKISEEERGKEVFRWKEAVKRATNWAH